MNARSLRGGNILFVNMYSHAGPPYPTAGPSAALGFGKTSSEALVRAVRNEGWHVATVPELPTANFTDELDHLIWLHQGYTRIAQRVRADPPDAILLFHLFSHFAVEVRRGLQLIRADVPLIGFVLGSHWDPTDVYRELFHPGLEVADLANMLALDRIYFNTLYMRETVTAEVGRVSNSLAAQLVAKSAVMPIPVDLGLVRPADRARSNDMRLVFNHAIIASKRPDVFVEAANVLLERFSELSVIITRAPENEWGRSVLAGLSSERVTLAGNLSIADYFSVLANCDLQVSTASHEGLGVATLEAMASRLCCVLPRVGSYPEIASTTPEAFYDGTAQGLVERVSEFIENPVRRSETAGKQQANAQLWGPERVGARISQDLEATLAVGRAPQPQGEP